MQLLILDNDADYLEQSLAAKFPDLAIHAVEREDEVGDIIKQADILLAKWISDGLLVKAESLQWIQSLLTGVDYFLDLPSLRKDILITSTRGIHGPQASELTLLLMLALNRKFPQNVRNQDRKKWDRWPGILLWQKKAGIIGVGVIGRAIAQKCKAFGMTVYGITRTKKDLDFVDHSFGTEGLIDVAREVDYLIDVLPSTRETRGMVGPAVLSAMKKSAFFINIGRGDTVDEDALVEVLKAGKIAGAGLDVFRTEPLPEDSPLWEMDNVVISPHVGGMSDIYADQALPIFEENLKRFLKGERRNLINVIDW